MKGFRLFSGSGIRSACFDTWRAMGAKFIQQGEGGLPQGRVNANALIYGGFNRLSGTPPATIKQRRCRTDS